jgi:hypothetical protein
MNIVEKLRQWSDTEWTKQFGIGEITRDDMESGDALRLCDDCAEAANRIAELEKIEESMRQVIDYCTYAQNGSVIAREVLKIVKDCGL